jgi:hypothetical protein
MTKTLAKKLGWKFIGNDFNDMTAEKGRIIFMGMNMDMILKLIEKTEVEMR